MSDTRTTEELEIEIRLGIKFDATYANEALDTLTSRLEAYEAEHEAVGQRLSGAVGSSMALVQQTHDHAERVRRGD